MIFYQQQVYIAFGVAGFLALLGLFVSFYRTKELVALRLLLVSAFFIRLAMSVFDPFLHDWDEKFHALVAKNMITNPFTPMLHVNPVMEYDYTAWCCNHIWLHKQPLFLWQMAASMKLFGVSLWALRLPAVIMGTLSVYFVYYIAKIWFQNKRVAFLAALFFSFFNYQLELTSGKHVTDQNDLAFAFYMLGSFWAFSKYTISEKKIKWALIIGVFVAGAVLNKWLTGLLVYSGWLVFILTDAEKRYRLKSYLMMGFSVAVSTILFLPWQIYTRIKFPLESKWESEYNRKHIFEVVENHGGDVFYHFNTVWENIGTIALFFLFIGFVFSFFRKGIDAKISMAFFTMNAVLFAFFSLIVATKMPSFTFGVWSLLLLYIALGFVLTWEYFEKKNNSIVGKDSLLGKIIYMVAVSFLVLLLLRPCEIAEYRKFDNEERNYKIDNAKIYKNLDVQFFTNNRIVLNLKPFNQIDLMFYKDATAYHWWPNKEVLDSLKSNGYQFAAFKNHNSQNLPSYILNDSSILIIEDVQK